MSTEPTVVTDLPFVREVLALFDQADCHGELFWRVNGDDIKLFALVNDVFAWGCADLEEITPETLTALQETYASLSVIGSTEYLPDLYAARQRQMRPQNAAMPRDPRARALFEACGPERPVDIGNPKALLPPHPPAPPR